MELTVFCDKYRWHYFQHVECSRIHRVATGNTTQVRSIDFEQFKKGEKATCNIVDLAPISRTPGEAILYRHPGGRKACRV